MTSVLVVQALAKQYRVPFFDGLHDALAREGIGLRVAYGDPPEGERAKGDDVVLDPSYGVHVGGRWLLRDRLHYQPVVPLARDADLVVVEQASKQLVNLPLLLQARLGRRKLAFWGQGRNLHCDERSIVERLKARTARLVDWWFAYTQGVADYVTSLGVRRDVVTVVQNAIDTRVFRIQLAAVRDAEISAARRQLGIEIGDPVGLFCGSLYAGKKIDFLIESARRIRAEIPGFHLLIVGTGPAERELAACAAGLDWIHILGRQSGAARAVYFRMAEVFLIPAWVGLAVVDAFAAGLPVITSDLPRSHSVEIEYIEHERNGLVSDHDAHTYAITVARLLRNRDLHRRLSDGARAAGDRYTIETMVDNFADGVMRCLRGPTAEGRR